ncbi:hypothetical protein T01_1209 [Trichinella spiralis]|uniref:Uncharacterized protein n=1 Tax=Trichinella spiralis TaxID=6334 RepID=A0A0V1BB75_TRISP|nr:hypothetical protein T01_1209 [Trichinella spiralis]
MENKNKEICNWNCFINFYSAIINVFTRKEERCELSKIITSESYFLARCHSFQSANFEGVDPLNISLNLKVMDAISKKDQVDSPFHCISLNN